MYIVQKILRHADIKTTVGIYGHLDIEDSREALKSMPAANHDKDLDPWPPSPSGGPDVPSLFQADGEAHETKAPAPRTSPLKPAPWIGAEHRVRTGDLRLGKAMPYTSYPLGLIVDPGYDRGAHCSM